MNRTKEKDLQADEKPDCKSFMVTDPSFTENARYCFLDYVL